MSKDRYRFKIGNFECLVINDGRIDVEGKQLFQNIDKDVYTPLLKARGEKSEKVKLAINTLAIFSDDWVLIDTGFGNFSEDSGQLKNILSEEDIRPEHIILTHAHPDHYGGFLDENGKNNFGNTPIYICQNEWILAISNELDAKNPDRAEYNQKYLIPIEAQIEPIECLDMNEILPNFSVIRLPGHTLNHIGILIESASEKLIFASDTLVHPLHLENLDWQAGFDVDHALARESRLKLAELAIELDATVMTSHFPFPGLGRIERYGASYKWIPLDI